MRRNGTPFAPDPETKTHTRRRPKRRTAWRFAARGFRRLSVGNAMKLLVDPSLELNARQLTVSVAANQTSNVNIYAGFIQPLVEPLIPNNRWYLFADPPTAPVYVYGYLNGAEGPQVTTGPVSGVDGVEVSVIFDFGVGAIDWRGAWFNPGV